jgi:dihydrofolate reductase
MSVKVSVYVAISLDGFIARKDGPLDWQDETNATIPKGEDCGQQTRFRSRVMPVAVRWPS